jgi:hypothetical protein
MVAPEVKLDGDHYSVFDHPQIGHGVTAWHPVLFYGNWRRELRAFCDLFGIEAILPQRA